MLIRILGSGCKTCDDLERCVRETIKEMKLNIVTERITDYTTIVKYGVLSTPALIIDNKIIVRGRVPTKKELQKIIKKHLLIAK